MDGREGGEELTHSFELTTHTNHFRQWGETTHSDMEVSVIKGGLSRCPPSGPELALRLHLDVSIWTMHLVALMLSASTFFRKIQPEQKHWGRFLHALLYV